MRDNLSILKNKIAVITGGNRGIGLAVAKLLGQEGCRLIITGRDAGQLAEAADVLKKNNTPVTALPCDISDAAQVEKLFQAVRKQYSSIDILVNNAGIAHALAPVEQLPVETWNQAIATNLTGMFLVTRAALPLMSAGATIVNNLSVAAVQSFPGMAAYNASKAGALGFTDVLREDVRKRGIRVLAVVAGATDTGIWNQFWADAPRHKMIAPETVAQAILHALAVPTEATIEQIRIGPAAGTL
jgi:NAD(P)-dependent dehydrogenase (short-subunit alcohol dehydrogenase family)